MNLQQAQAAKLVASQQLRIRMCEVEIAQFQDQLADWDLITATGGVPVMPRETLERLLTEPQGRLVGLETELVGLQTALGGV